MDKFKSHAQYRVLWLNWEQDVFIVKLDRLCYDFDWLVGHAVEIDGKEYTVRAVERFTHSPPWMQGEDIGILV